MQRAIDFSLGSFEILYQLLKALSTSRRSFYQLKFLEVQLGKINRGKLYIHIVQHRSNQQHRILGNRKLMKTMIR